MGIFTRFRRRTQQLPAPAAPALSGEAGLLRLADSIAGSQARLLLISDRVAAGRAEAGDEARLRIQREITASFRKRIEKVALPTDIGDDVEVWLRSTPLQAPADGREYRPH
ncbi:hypothetical protein IWX63_001641 [Arthrobacter sp. CAN_A2]|uniref:hypothetical protein n=1 Tax=Arthrobacter sp. CAN_A2 TaxID=2787718 RepID=UPI0018EFCCCA